MEKELTSEERLNLPDTSTLNLEKYYINYDGSIRRHEPKIKMSKKERIKRKKNELH